MATNLKKSENWLKGDFGVMNNVQIRICLCVFHFIEKPLLLPPIPIHRSVRLLAHATQPWYFCLKKIEFNMGLEEKFIEVINIYLTETICLLKG